MLGLEQRPDDAASGAHDLRVAAVLSVLAGARLPDAAHTAGVEPALLERWCEQSAPSATPRGTEP